MSQKMIWVDITELAHWKGRLTGVPRVMDELSSRFNQISSCKFVTWDNSKSGYIEYNQRKSKNQRRPSYITGKALAAPKRIAGKLLKSRLNHPVVDSSIRPQKGDVLFVLADWHSSDPAFGKYLVDLKKRKVKLAQISYDLLPIVAPQYSCHATEYLTIYTKQIYPLCDVIFAISKNTKRDIITWLEQNNLRVPRIEVIRLGDDFKLASPIKPSVEQLAVAENFILCIGTIEARKNHTLLYYVYKLAHQRNITLPKLVIVGRRGWMTENIHEIMTTDPQTKDKFIILESASDEELSWLYKNCTFSIYPSFYEGWGLPIAESIAHEAPCICSNTSSMPEVAGDLINYFNPTSTDECLEAIIAMLEPKAVDDAKKKLQKYKPTSWATTFSSVRNIIEEINGQKT
jgi:glycosyltransferase involved in cell wall biosynthesis